MESARTDHPPPILEAAGPAPYGATNRRRRRQNPHGAAVSAGSGAVAGMAWGIVARAWMRLISESPEFSWSGTLFIVLVPTVAGALLGAASARRRVGRALPIRTGAGISLLFLGVGAGMLMLPTIFLGGLALARRSFPWWMRLASALGVLGAGFLVGGAASSFGQLAAASALGGVAVVLGIGWKIRALIGGIGLVTALGVMASVLLGTDLPWWRDTIGALAYAPLVAVPTLAVTIVFRPSGPGDDAQDIRPRAPVRR